MKALSPQLTAHLQGEVTTLCTCFKVTRRDGAVLGFTTSVIDLVVSGVTYIAASGGFAPTALRSTSDLAVDNLDVQVLLESGMLTEADLLAGLYDYAEVEIFEVNYRDLGMEIISLPGGTIGNVACESGRNHATLELRGITQKLQQVIGRLHGKRCDADLFDARCGLSPAAHQVSGTVTAVTSRQVFTLSTVPARPGGKLSWTSGANDNLEAEIKSIAGFVVTLHLPLPFDPQLGDAYTALPGCDRLHSTCRDVYLNLANFRGYGIFMPGPDRIMQYPDAR